MKTILTVIGCCIIAHSAAAEETTKAFDLPPSDLRSAASLQAPKKAITSLDFSNIMKELGCPSGHAIDPAAQDKAKACMVETYYKAKIYRDMVSKYQTTIAESKIAGVPVTIVVPKAGIAPPNKDRVLIELHGGAYDWASIHEIVMNAVPMAAVGKIKVVSVDFAKAPAHRFPAASKDVAAVYRALLKTYKPENIGMMGCTLPSLAGAMVPWLLQEKLPLPGAIAMLCGGTGKLGGDSMQISSALWGKDAGPVFETYFKGEGAYFEHVDMNNPLILPDGFDDVMKQFPPTSLVGTSRGFALSSVIKTHRTLTRLGVDTELHLWEGMKTGFQQEPLRPETQEMFEVLARFFDKYLGR